MRKLFVRTFVHVVGVGIGFMALFLVIAPKMFYPPVPHIAYEIALFTAWMGIFVMFPFQIIDAYQYSWRQHAS